MQECRALWSRSRDAPTWQCREEQGLFSQMRWHPIQLLPSSPRRCREILAARREGRISCLQGHVTFWASGCCFLPLTRSHALPVPRRRLLCKLRSGNTSCSSPHAAPPSRIVFWLSLVVAANPSTVHQALLIAGTLDSTKYPPLRSPPLQGVFMEIINQSREEQRGRARESACAEPWPTALLLPGLSLVCSSQVRIAPERLREQGVACMQGQAATKRHSVPTP
jgi:hypothetical protein